MDVHVFSRILFATDFGPSAARALQLAGGLACSSAEAQLQILHVYSIPLTPMPAAGGIGTIQPMLPPPGVVPVFMDNLDSVRKQLDGLLREVRRTCPAASARLEQGNPGKVIIAVAEEWPADLIVVGTHGRTGVSRVLLGSVAEHVVRHATMPVLSARAT